MGRYTPSSDWKPLASARNWPGSSRIHWWTIRRALYIFLHRLVMAPVLTRIQRYLVVRRSFVSPLDHHHKMTTITVVPNEVLVAYHCHSRSHTQGHHRPTTVCSVLLHRLINFRPAPLYESRRTKTLSPGRSSTTPALRSYRHLCLAASWLDEIRATFKASLRQPCNKVYRSCLRVLSGGLLWGDDSLDVLSMLWGLAPLMAPSPASSFSLAPLEVSSSDLAEVPVMLAAPPDLLPNSGISALFDL